MIALLVGTRPEIIKMAPVLRELKKRGLPHLFIHSDQHYSEEMDARIIADLSLGEPDIHLHVGSASHALQTGKVMAAVEQVCIERKVSFLLVHGDTNTTLGGALAAKKLQIPVGHIEAGLRSFDWRMPEEINRTIVDRISDVHFAPTSLAKKNLVHEGISRERIVITGNTIVDALLEHKKIAQKPSFFSQKDIHSHEYLLLTLHRAENIDSKPVFEQMLALVRHASTSLGKKVLWPIHPRAQQRLQAFSLTIPRSVLIVPPVGYLEMIYMLEHASLILTDSGGIQEEAYILRKPLMTLRDSTERPETLSANFIIHHDCALFDQAWSAYEQKIPFWEDNFGKGRASKKIVDSLVKRNIL